jgi:hypothetical protein
VKHADALVLLEGSMKRILIVPAFVITSALTGCSAVNSAAGSLALPSPDRVMTLRQDMRRLWSDHVVWTRQYIVAAVAGDPSATVALNRLMKNQEDIGNAMRPFYGDGAGTKLTDLLKQHISIAGELVTAAKAGDQAKQNDADRRWHDNAGEIASFLAGANPNWKRDALLGMLNQHLALTTQEAVDRLQQKWTDDQMTFDKIYSQAMEMADALSEGIIKQFPTKV